VALSAGELRARRRRRRRCRRRELDAGRPFQAERERQRPRTGTMADHLAVKRGRRDGGPAPPARDGLPRDSQPEKRRAAIDRRGAAPDCWIELPGAAACAEWFSLQKQGPEPSSLSSTQNERPASTQTQQPDTPLFRARPAASSNSNNTDAAFWKYETLWFFEKTSGTRAPPFTLSRAQAAPPPSLSPTTQNHGRHGDHRRQRRGRRHRHGRHRRQGRPGQGRRRPCAEAERPRRRGRPPPARALARRQPRPLDHAADQVPGHLGDVQEGRGQLLDR